MARYAESIQSDRALYLVNLDIPPGHEAIRYLAPEAKVASWTTTDPAPRIAGGTRLAFAMSYDGSNGAAALTSAQTLFPSGAQRILYDSNGRPIFRVWEVPATSTP